MQLLLAEGADIEQYGSVRDEFATVVLRALASFTSHLLSQTLMILCVQFGDTPLIRAAFNGHFHAVQHLIQEGANLDARDIGKIGLPQNHEGVAPQWYTL